MSAEPIDFDDIKWGSLTKQLQAFNRKNRTKMNLESFSKHILANPTKFIERSKDRARFYLNVIKPRAKKGGALSSHVMSDLLAQSYETKNKKKRRLEVDGFHIDPSLSGERVQVWYNPTTRQAVVVHRGTAGFQDVMTDARLFFGDKSGKRFRHADNIQKKAEAKYGKAHVSTIGHSLGSSVAEKVGQGSKEVLTLNKPTTLEDLAKGKKVSEKQTDVRTKYDPVSILRPYQKGSDAIEIESTTWNPLAEHKTDTLKRLDEGVMIGRGKLGMMMRGGADAPPDPVPDYIIGTPADAPPDPISPAMFLIDDKRILRDMAQELLEEYRRNTRDREVWDDLNHVLNESLKLVHDPLYMQQRNQELNAIANDFGRIMTSDVYDKGLRRFGFPNFQPYQPIRGGAGDEGSTDGEDDVLDLIEGMTALRDRAEELTQEHLNNPNDQGVWSDLLTVFREAIRLQNTALYRQELAGNVELNAIANAFNNMHNRVWLADDDDDDDNMEGGGNSNSVYGFEDSTEGANVEQSTDATEGSISSKGSISASSDDDDDDDNDNDIVPETDPERERDIERLIDNMTELRDMAQELLEDYLENRKNNNESDKEVVEEGILGELRDVFSEAQQLGNTPLYQELAGNNHLSDLANSITNVYNRLGNQAQSFINIDLNNIGGRRDRSDISPIPPRPPRPDRPPQRYTFDDLLDVMRDLRNAAAELMEEHLNNREGAVGDRTFNELRGIYGAAEGLTTSPLYIQGIRDNNAELLQLRQDFINIWNRLG